MSTDPVTGGVSRSQPTEPWRLWTQANDEHPNDQAARRIRYIELMRQHGHIRPTLPGEKPLHLRDCEPSETDGSR